MSRQLSLFKYLQSKPPKKRQVAEDNIDLVIAERIYPYVQMRVYKIIDVVANQKNIKNEITQGNVNSLNSLNSVKNSLNSLKKSK